MFQSLKTAASLAVLLVAATACGTSSDSAQSDLQAARGAQGTETVLTDVQVHQVASGLRIQGQVILGSNPCMARGKTAKLVRETVSGEIHIKALIQSTRPADERVMCTMEYNPQYAKVALTARVPQSLFPTVVIENVDELGNDVRALDFLGVSEIVMKNVSVTPVNAGINPDAFAYVVEATVLAGANPCIARNTEVKLTQKLVGDVLYVVAIAKDKNPGTMCTMEYNPQYATLSTEVRSLHSLVGRVVLKNVDVANNDRDIDSLLD